MYNSHITFAHSLILYGYSWLHSNVVHLDKYFKQSNMSDSIRFCRRLEIGTKQRSMESKALCHRTSSTFTCPGKILKEFKRRLNHLPCMRWDGRDIIYNNMNPPLWVQLVPRGVQPEWSRGEADATSCGRLPHTQQQEYVPGWLLRLCQVPFICVCNSIFVSPLLFFFGFIARLCVSGGIKTFRVLYL